MGVGASVLAVVTPAATAAVNQPQAAIEWSVDARTAVGGQGHGRPIPATYYSCGGAVEDKGCTVPAGQIQSPTFRLRLDGGQSTGAALYTFEVRRQDGSLFGAHGPDSSPQAMFEVPDEGPWTVRLGVSTGQDEDWVETTARPRDLLVVSLGDSYGSGEGAPDLLPTSQNPLAWKFSDERCGRSRLAASAQAAARLEEYDPKTTVTFIHLACSGAQIKDSDPAAGGLLDGYKGINPVSGEVLPPQVQELWRIIGSRTVDFLHLSIGGNDMGFAPILKRCMGVDPVWEFVSEWGQADCFVGQDATIAPPTGPDPAWYTFERGIADLPNRYRELAAALADFVPPERVYLTEYPDPTTSDDGSYCSGPFGFTPAEYRWADTVVGASLMSVMKQSSRAAGWNYVGGNYAKFRGHGYCATSRWFTQLTESLATQVDQNGTFHPNARGQTEMADTLYSRFAAHLVNPPKPPEILLYPADPFLLSIGKAGSLGWWTGSGSLFTSVIDRSKVTFTARMTFASGAAHPVADNISVILDGVPVNISGTGRQLGCTTPALQGNCDVITSEGTVNNPRVVDFVLALEAPGVHTLTVSGTDQLGRSSSSDFELRFDGSAPTVHDAAIVSGSTGQNGWYVSPVGLQFSATDPSPGSGLSRIDVIDLYGGPQGQQTGLPLIGGVGQVSAEGTTTLTYQAVDNAGLRSPGKSLSISVDTRPPTIAVAYRSPDARNWYNTPLPVTFTATDPSPGSGIATVTPGITLGEGAAQTVNSAAVDNAGHQGATSSGPFNVDLTDPSITITAAGDGTYSYTAAELASGIAVTNMTSLTLDYTASDALSGLHEVRIGSQSSSSQGGPFTVPLHAGINSLTLTAEDIAGNTTTLPIEVLSIAPADISPSEIGPRGVGFWGQSLTAGHYTEPQLAAIVQSATFASRAFGGPTNVYADVTMVNLSDFLGYAGPDHTLQIRRQLVASWLNLASGRVVLGTPVDVTKVKGWSVALNAAPTSALALLRAVDERLTLTLTSKQAEKLREILTAFNDGKLN